MATMIVRHKVADFNTWKTVFDSMIPTRKSFGWIGHDLHRDSADPNMVTIVNKMTSIEGAKSYAASPDLKDGMQKAGVISQPEIILMNDEESVQY